MIVFVRRRSASIWIDTTNGSCMVSRQLDAITSGQVTIGAMVSSFDTVALDGWCIGFLESKRDSQHAVAGGFQGGDHHGGGDLVVGVDDEGADVWLVKQNPADDFHAAVVAIAVLVRLAGEVVIEVDVFPRTARSQGVDRFGRRPHEHRPRLAANERMPAIRVVVEEQDAFGY
jgi:hypothetical protein